MTFMCSPVSWIAVSATGLSCWAGLSLQSERLSSAETSGVQVRLEPHGNKIQFKLGDPISVDLVFTAKSPGYAVFMDSNAFNAPQDLVNVTPANGWLRFQGAQSGGSPEDFGQSPVRVPVMLNRSIVFQKPGQYEVTVTTSRVAPSRTGASPGTGCCTARRSETTNTVTIDILPRDEREESAMVTRLSSRIARGKPDAFLSDKWKKQHAPLMREMDDLEKNLTDKPSDLDSQKAEKAVREFHAAEAEDEKRIATQTEARRQTATGSRICKVTMPCARRSAGFLQPRMTAMTI